MTWATICANGKPVVIVPADEARRIVENISADLPGIFTYRTTRPEELH